MFVMTTAWDTKGPTPPKGNGTRMGPPEPTKVTVVDSAGLEVLDETECRLLLDCSEIGRVAVMLDNYPAIFPVTFRFVDGRVIFFTGEGTKLSSVIADGKAAFEVDWFDPLSRSGWSVVVVGTARALTDPRDPELARAVERLHIHPWTPADRPYVVVLQPDHISGRRLPRNAPVPSEADDRA